MSIRNFKISEFYCNDGTKIPKEYIDNVNELMINLQVLRDAIDVPIYISSGYRHKEYNKSVGGVKNSQHLYAKAADIYTEYHTPKELHKKINDLQKENKMKDGGLGLYNTFVHYDIRNYRARWYRS